MKEERKYMCRECVKLDEINAFIKKYDLPLPEVTTNDDALTVLFRIVEAQAEAIRRLREC